MGIKIDGDQVEDSNNIIIMNIYCCQCMLWAYICFECTLHYSLGTLFGAMHAKPFEHEWLNSLVAYFSSLPKNGLKN